MSETLFPAALRHIVAAIEPEILIKAFGQKEINPFAIINIPIETHIEREVIINQVVKDIQLFDSKETHISLDGLPSIQISEDYSTIYVPESRRGGRDIMSVHGISYGSSQHLFQGSSTMAEGSNMASAASSMLGSLNRYMPDTEHDAVIVAPNTILVNNRMQTSTMAMLHVNLTVDDKLTHIRNATSIPFIELCIWKTKQLCYTKLNIALGQNLIHQGKELGIFMDVVREWRDARQTYMELLAKFQTTAKLNDPIARKRIIRQRLPKLIG